MSAEIPANIGELSRHALHEAIEKVDLALDGAPEDIRKAVAVIRLVTDMPRRCPWYGVPVDPDDSSVTVGVVLRNLLDFYWGNEDYRREMLRVLEGGKQDYNEHLDRLLDPERDRAEFAEPGLSREHAAEAWRADFSPWEFLFGDGDWHPVTVKAWWLDKSGRQVVQIEWSIAGETWGESFRFEREKARER